ncbi:MAG: penicillin-binding protein [Actinomycetota bacterium]
MTRRLPRLLCGFLALVALVAGCRGLADLEDAEQGATALPQTSFLYASDGSVLKELHGGENRIVVPSHKIPDPIRDAVVAVEDRRFYQHHGVDLKALARAAYTDAAAGEIVEGGSTITQQYVKQVFVGDDQTLERKLKEASLAWQLEEKYTKDEILTRYLNTVYFGRGAYGVQAAAQAFFSIDAPELDLQQSALLAGLVQSPSAYNPFRHPKVAAQRRNDVLRLMRDQHLVARAAYRKARSDRLRLRPAAVDRTAAPYFVDYVLRWFLVTPSLQRVESFGPPCPFDRPLSRKACEQRWDAFFSGGLRIQTTLDPQLQTNADRAVNAVLRDEDDPYGAMTVIDPNTGFIKAMVGGRNYYDPDDPFAKINLAAGGSTGRQGGSSFKPFALVAALENGISPDAVYPAPGSIELPLEGGRGWKVSNSDGGSYGSLTLEDATINSVNTVYAQLILQLGPEKVNEVATRMGLRCCYRTTSPQTTELIDEPSAVLGANDVNSIEMASAFGTLATGGYHVDPTPVVSIRDSEGSTLWKPAERGRLAVDPQVAAAAADILQQAVTFGTGTGADIGRPQIGKTGTDDGYTDAWFVGAVPQLTAAVWIGFPQGQIAMDVPRTRITVFGGTWPADIWRTFMVDATRNLPAQRFPTPKVRYVSVKIDVTQDCLPNRYTLPRNIEPVEFITGTQPIEVCAEPTSTQSADIPSTIGLYESAARELLEQSGFFTEVRYVRSNQPRGTVISQTPSAGLRAQQTSTVTITVSGI